MMRGWRVWFGVTFGLAIASGAQGQNATPINGPGSTLSQKPRPSLAGTAKIPVGLQLMARFDLLPLLRDSVCLQDSSYDRTGGNGDLGNFLRREGNKAVLADIKGPGCIYRIWSANAKGQLRIYFDGEATPRIDCLMQDFFLGKVAPFVAPLVGHKSGGWYSFFPLPFAKSCRVEVTDPGSMYYHVQYQRLPDEATVTTYTSELSAADKAALDIVLEQWRRRGTDPKESLPSPAQASIGKATGKINLAPGETKTLTTLDFPGQINAFHLKLDPMDRFTLRQTVVRVYWDGATSPGIEAPVGDFFGVGFGAETFRAMPTALTEAGGVCYWPMPFARSARVELANLGKTEIKTAEWNIATTRFEKPLENVGYFHAQWHREKTVSGEPFHILQTHGRGHYVGTHVDMQGDRGIGFLEGDEKFRVDGEAFPSIYGTGSEDFYTGGWYFDEGPFDLPYHGCVVKSDAMSRVSAYRYQIQDCVPFQNELKVEIEHGGMNDYPGADYACVAYWYQATPDHDWSPIAAAQLTPAVFRVADALEAEDLLWSGNGFARREDTTLPAETSGGKVMALEGEKAVFSLDVKEEDVYTVHLSQIMAADSSRKVRSVRDDHADDLSSVLEVENNTVDTRPGTRWEAFQPMRISAGKHTFTMQAEPGKRIYLDYIQLLPSRKEKGVIEAERLIEKADVGGKGAVARQDGDEGWSGSSVLEWKPSEAGATLKLPIMVDREGDYSLELGVSRNANSPTISVRMDGTDLPETVALTMQNGSAATQRIRFGRLPGLKAGAHLLTIVYRGGEAKTPVLLLDYIRLQKSLYPNTVEAEGLKLLEAKGGQATHQEMTGFGKAWSGDDQFWFLAEEVGAEAMLELPILTTGKYRLSAYYTSARDYGIVQMLIDGKAVGKPTDLYTENVLATGKVELDTLDLTVGSHRLSFRVVGKNAKSSNYLIGVDAIGLEPVR